MTFAELDTMLYSQTATETAALQLLPQTQRYLVLMQQLENGAVLTSSDAEFVEQFRTSSAWMDYGLDSRDFTSTDVMFESQKGVFHIVQQERYRVEPLHRHRFFELFVVYAGSCELTIDQKKVTLHQGDVCLLNLNTMHSLHPLGAGDIVICMRMKQELMAGSRMENAVGDNLLVQQFYFARARGETVPPYLRISCAGRDHFMSIIRLMLSEYFGNDILSFPVLVGCYAPFFAELSRAYYPQAERISNKSENFTKIIEYIKRFHRVCTIEDLAHRYGYAPAYLSALIKKKTGKSFSDLRREYRMATAAELLLTTRDTIADIATVVGYSNLTYFYRVFQQFYGMTPQEYRARKSG